MLTVSYPSYEKWLERIEKIEGSPICKMDPIRRCSLKKPNTNRWKFQCKYKNILKFYFILTLFRKYTHIALRKVQKLVSL